MKKSLVILLAMMLLLSISFTGCTNEPVETDPYADMPETPVEEFTYSKQEDYIAISGFVGHSKIVKIPEKIEDRPVTIIGMNAFMGAEIEELILPNTVTDIMNEAFLNCKQLRNVRFNDGLVNIDQGAFKECIALEKVSFPNTLELIGTYAFYKCTNMQQAHINGTELLIGVEAFYGNSSLETLTIDGVRKINDVAFGGCDKLTNVTFLCNIPESVDGYTFRMSNGDLPVLHYKKGVAGVDNSSLADYTLKED